jgi:glycosyltransferase involved in cell wall biosynthesis
VIIAVKNEESYIAKCLDSLINQTLSKRFFNIIVVDGKSTDKTINIVKKYVKKHPKFINLIKNPNEWQASGRNIAIKNNTECEFIAYIDGHCIADKNWLKQLYSSMKKCSDKNIAGIGSTHISPKDEAFFGKAVDQVFNSILGGLGSSYRVAKEKREVDTAPFVLYRRKALENVDFYDEDMKYGEDYSLNYKLRKKGYKILVDPQAIVYYYKKKTLKSFLRQMYNYGTAKAIIGKKYPGAISITHCIPSVFLLSFLILTILSIHFTQIRLFTLVTILIYILSIIIFSFVSALRKKEALLAGLMPILYFIEHLAYSIGFFRGFFKKGWVR